MLILIKPLVVGESKGIRSYSTKNPKAAYAGIKQEFRVVRRPGGVTY